MANAPAHHIARGTARRGFVVAGVVLGLLMAGGIAAAGLGADGPPSSARTVVATGAAPGAAAGQVPKDDARPDTATAPPPDGVDPDAPVLIAGAGGEVVGQVSAEAWRAAGQDGPPVRRFGTGGRTLQALEVVDERGELVGYYTTGALGFVPLAVAQDPAAMDRLLAEVPVVAQPVG